MLEQITAQEVFFAAGVLGAVVFIIALRGCGSRWGACDVCKTGTDLLVFSIRTDREGKRICDECQRDEAKEFERAQVIFRTTGCEAPGYEWLAKTS